MAANDRQHGGDHYKKFNNFEPWDVITAWGLGYLDGTALKYISRWRHKGGIEDLQKAIHFLEKCVEVTKSSQLIEIKDCEARSTNHWYENFGKVKWTT